MTDTDHLLPGWSDDTEVRETSHAALSNLVAVLDLAGRGQIKCSEKTRRPTAASVEAVARVLQGGDFYRDESLGPIAAFAWPLLIQAGGLAQMNGTRLDPTTRGRAVMAAPTYPALAGLWGKWQAKALIDEFSRVEAIKGQRKAATLTAPLKRRTGVALGLADLPMGEWIETDAAFRGLRRHPELKIARNERAAWNLYLEDAQYGSMGYDGFGSWEVLEGRYALCVMFEYAATLGLLDVAYRDPEDARNDFRHLWGAEDYGYLSRYDGLVAVRVNTLGAAVLRARPAEDLVLPAVAPVAPVVAVAAQPGRARAARSARVAESAPPMPRTSTRCKADRAIVSALSDASAMRVFAAVVPVAGPDQPDQPRPGIVSYRYITVTGIGKVTGLTPEVINAAVARLAEAGVLTCDGDPEHGWRISPHAFTP
ncbi:hypothetical protein [Actinospica robiniae]|uniref:hypothetical protein n=1 Tax=Actinospica robiniae TaxID=304901 RepID=UPI00040DE5C7|nr:hypothetical protein [Actinospica robiniae]